MENICFDSYSPHAPTPAVGIKRNGTFSPMMKKAAQRCSVSSTPPRLRVVRDTAAGGTENVHKVTARSVCS
eukprot:196046-Rhodomonas_salina.1